MRQLLLALMGLVFLFLVWNTQCNYTEDFNAQSEKQLQQRSLISPKQSIPLFEEINAANKNITTLQGDVELVAKLDRSVRLTGNMHYSKPNLFRMTMNSIVGKELDLGSNETYFWFWSKRSEPAALNYAKHEDVDKMKLGSPFNPKWILGSLGVTPIEYSDANVDDYNGSWRIIRTEKNVITCVIVDPKKKAIIGRSIYTLKGDLISASEIKSHQVIDGHVVPKQITMIWYEENIGLNLTLRSVSVNKEISSSMWIMPNINPKINIGKD